MTQGDGKSREVVAERNANEPTPVNTKHVYRPQGGNDPSPGRKPQVARDRESRSPEGATYA